MKRLPLLVKGIYLVGMNTALTSQGVPKAHKQVSETNSMHLSCCLNRLHIKQLATWYGIGGVRLAAFCQT